MNYTCTRMTDWLIICQFLLVYHIYSKDSTSSCRYMHTRLETTYWKLTAIDCSRYGDLIVLPLSDPCASSRTLRSISPLLVVLLLYRRSIVDKRVLPRWSKLPTRDRRVKIENPKPKLQRWWWRFVGNWIWIIMLQCMWMLRLQYTFEGDLYVVERMNHDGWICVW